MSTPNLYADRIEWFDRNIKQRQSVVLSVHPHNDRGCGVAAAELAVMAGAQRVEGTLFGNGERTGNVDIVTLALNLHTQGVDPGLDFSNIDEVAAVAQYCNRLPIHPRHPYAGELVYTAFSGSHQDAINKGLAVWRAEPERGWEVPYLPIDPADVGRSYEAVIRINSQSGKGGVAYMLESEHGLKPPRELLVEFGRVIQALAEQDDGELTSLAVRKAFEREYVQVDPVLRLVDYSTHAPANAAAGCQGRFVVDYSEQRHVLVGQGNGPVDAFVAALATLVDAPLELDLFHQHGVGKGADALGASYVRVGTPGAGSFGVGLDGNIVTASLKAVMGAVDRQLAAGRLRVTATVRAGKPDRSLLV